MIEQEKVLGLQSIPLGCPLDPLFGNGLQTRTITQVYGPPASGKTNVALLAITQAARMGLRSVFIDPEGSFSQERLKQIAGKDYDTVMESTILMEPSSFAEQAEMIASLEQQDVSLIVVDSIVYHYRLEFDPEQRHECSRELGMQAAQLLDLARKKNAAVLITNQVYSNPDTQRTEPVAGDTLKYASKIVVGLETRGERVAHLVRHTFKKEGDVVRFKIVGAGIV
jgi:DNA repair protein RadB